MAEQRRANVIVILASIYSIFSSYGFTNHDIQRKQRMSLDYNRLVDNSCVLLYGFRSSMLYYN